MSFDAVVLGAGAAGLFFAFQAARRGRRILVLEHNETPGRKILISGGGRCNFTNRDTRPECFLSANPHFVKSALARYTPRDFLTLLAEHRISWHEKTLGQLFCDHSARQILDMLLGECAAARVEVRCGERITSVRREGAIFVVDTGRGPVRAAAVVVATGGPSIPKLGATGFAYEIARQFGLRVVPPRPALVPLTFRPEDLRVWAGLSGVAADSQVSFARRSFRERLLFTHRGLSGPAILQISSYWQPGRPVSIDLTPAIPLDEPLLSRKQTQDRTMFRNVLAEYLPERLASAWAARDPRLDRPLFQVPDAALRSIAGQLQSWQFTPAGTEGFEKAEVAAGGVDTACLSSKTMEAAAVPGLYFIGECVDVTGWLGGYNFQWAWASAYAAAQAI
jgi:hypothetical protein